MLKAVCPSGNTANPQTEPVWPRNVRTSEPSDRSHIRTMLSAPPESAILPSYEKQRAKIHGSLAALARMRRMGFPALSQCQSTPRPVVVKAVDPSGENATANALAPRRESGQFAAARQVPDAAGAIPTAGGGGVAVGREGDGRDSPRVRSEHFGTAVAQIPVPHGVVTSAGQRVKPVGREGHRDQVGGVIRATSDELSRGRVP